MSLDNRQRAYKRDLLLASIMVVAGFAMFGLSLAQLDARNPQLAQATPPLQSTPGADTKPSKPSDPSDSTTTGTRPNEIPPQPAHPDTEAQKAGATPALPSAPAEKIAPAIREK